MLDTLLLAFAEGDALSRWLRIVLVDLMLAGDNAVVIALAVRTLPPRQQTLGRLWGTAGAVGLRLLFIALVTWLLGIPLLQLAGGLVLLWIAVKLLRQQQAGAGPVEGEAHGRPATSLRDAIRIIIVADVSMSLDNVFAIAGTAQGDLTLVVFGIALSIPLVVWGSSLLSALMNRFVWIVWLGGGVLGLAAGELIVGDETLKSWLGQGMRPLEHSLPWGLTGLLTGLGWWWRRREGVGAVEGAR